MIRGKVKFEYKFAESLPNTTDRVDKELQNDIAKANRNLVGGDKVLVHIPHIPLNKSDTLINIEKDTIAIQAYRGPNLVEYVVPGMGHLHFGEKIKDYSFTGFYALAGAFLVGSSIYYKNESNKSYRIHKEASFFNELDASYEVANENHQRHLYYAGAGITIMAINAIHIIIRNGKQKKREEQRMERERKTLLSFNNYGGGVGLAFTLKF